MFLLLIALSQAITPTEREALDAGEVVLHELTPRSPEAIRVQGFVDIATNMDAVWTALLDFKARMTANKSLKTIEYYRPSTPTDQWVAWTASSFGFEISYHNHYILKRDQGILIHELDTSLPNDLKASVGTYHISPSTRGTLLDYDVESNFGVTMPDVVKRWLTNSAIRDFLEDIAARATR